MKNNKKKLSLLAFSLLSLGATVSSPVIGQQANFVKEQRELLKPNKDYGTHFEIKIDNQQKIELEFYADNIFRWLWDKSGKSFRTPKASPPAEILVQKAKQKAIVLSKKENDKSFVVETSKIKLVFNKVHKLMNVTDLETGQVVVKEIMPAKFTQKSVKLTLSQKNNEYYYGGGVQNGRFSHKGRKINIVNENSWTDGGVASPKPFYWSTAGYGFMWHTFAPGRYNFGTEEKDKVELEHDVNYLDVFFMISSTPQALLNDYYQLTGEPILLPKFGFYQGHLNAYNRDYWKENKNGILFEDGKKYIESQKDNGGVRESLNGEKHNYQFSARAVIDRYSKHDMPLGWILPNDGYGAGYGQTSSLKGNIKNLKDFGDYARKKGVEIGLWTQSDLHPIDSIAPLLQRDIVGEIHDAGVRLLKTDVAWVGAGYSFGLNGIQEVAQIMPREGNGARPFIISLDGWAGTQHYAGIWSGDQTGGEWEYIRFHIPTYIGSGLSGQPNISSDMDGIFGGKKPIINVRDFQWKTFSPMQLNMDGWGSNPKYPHIMGEPYTSINRNYLKLKSELLPYTYSIAHEAIAGLPIIRPMFVEGQSDFTLGSATKYQYLYGPYFLIAPIYRETNIDDKGNDIRNNIYLPKGEWIDYFTGEKYEGGVLINNYDAPLWKLPILVKNGAIIPKNNPNNNPSEINQKLRIFEVYPAQKTKFTLYDDDGNTVAYKNGEYSKTLVESEAKGNKAIVNIAPTKGNFKGFEKNKATEIQINVTAYPKGIVAKINGKKIKLREAKDEADFERNQNVYKYFSKPNFNRFATSGSDFSQLEIVKNPQVRVKIEPVDITEKAISVEIKGFEFNVKNSKLSKKGKVDTPHSLKINEKTKSAYTIEPVWTPVENADYYEIKWGDMLYTTIKANSFLFEDLTPETEYIYKVRAVNKSGKSDWIEGKAKTNADPYQFAIKGITGKISVKTQGGEELYKLFDMEESGIMHTDYATKATPFEITMDLNSFNELDRLVYVPRATGHNGIFIEGDISYSENAKSWSKPEKFSWKISNENKTFEFSDKPMARYVKLRVTESIGDFGSGREIYIFRVKGTDSYLPGDVNNDKKIDENDLTSYLNYIGLKQGDSDFEGYISRGDVNKNQMIDAFDVSNVAVKLDGGVGKGNEILKGNIEIKADKSLYRAGENVIITVKGKGLASVNAFSFALPYDASKLEYVKHQGINTSQMYDMTKNRLHTSGESVLYPTYVNLGNKKLLNGDVDLLQIQFKAKKDFKFDLQLKKGILVDRNLNEIEQ